MTKKKMIEMTHGTLQWIFIVTIIINLLDRWNVVTTTTTTTTGFIIIPVITIGRRRRRQQQQQQHNKYYNNDNNNYAQRLFASSSSPLSSEEVQSRLVERIKLLREKDRKGKIVRQEELKIIYEDDNIIVIDKPSGVLCVPSEPGVPSIVQTVYDYCCNNNNNNDSNNNNAFNLTMNQMVVHRLGFDTSGLIVFGKTITAVRGLNTIFRTRKITRQYEVLVTGHVINTNNNTSSSSSSKNTTNNNTNTKHGLINLPLMRCYEYPPYMRISTNEHQRKLLQLDPNIVNKKLLQPPKASLTHYQIIQHEYWNNDTTLPITRMTLTSITGRTHQLNVHCAAIGHPIVRDTVYGYKGTAASNGGLDTTTTTTTTVDDNNNNIQQPASIELQKAIADAASDSNMCVHAKLIKFRHPITGQIVEFTSKPSF